VWGIWEWNDGWGRFGRVKDWRAFFKKQKFNSFSGKWIASGLERVSEIGRLEISYECEGTRVRKCHTGTVHVSRLFVVKFKESGKYGMRYFTAT